MICLKNLSQSLAPKIVSVVVCVFVEAHVDALCFGVCYCIARGIYNIEYFYWKAYYTNTRLPLVKESKRRNVKYCLTQPAGFEPARGDPIGFQVQRLNHSATTANQNKLFPNKCRFYPAGNVA